MDIDTFGPMDYCIDHSMDDSVDIVWCRGQAVVPQSHCSVQSEAVAGRRADRVTSTPAPRHAL